MPLPYAFAVPRPEPNRLITLLLAAGGGVATRFAFPDAGWWPLAYVGTALLFLALRRDRAWWNALVGLVWGVAFFAPLITWADSAVGWIPWLALSVVEAGFVALFAGAWTWARRGEAVWRSAGLQVVVFAVLWVGAEELRQVWPFGGFPWGRLAFSQADAPMAALMSIAGTPLESHPTPPPSFMHAILAPLADMLVKAGMQSSRIKAGCGKCGACSALSTYEKRSGA